MSSVPVPPKVLDLPKEPWLDRLRKDHLVWLVKEQEYARVEFAWDPPEPGYRSGRIAIRQQNNYQLGSWFIDINGRGLDGSQLFLPTEGSLPESAEPISEPMVRHIHRQLDLLNRKVEAQSRTIRLLCNHLGLPYSD